MRMLQQLKGKLAALSLWRMYLKRQKVGKEKRHKKIKHMALDDQAFIYSRLFMQN